MHAFNKNLFLLSLLVVVVGACLYRFPSDDGLRHVGVAFSHFKSWGEVYPFSMFQQFQDYDPWFGYDFCLRMIASGLRQLPLSESVMKFLMVKGLSFLFLGAFFFLVLSRSGILKQIKDRHTFTVAYMVLMSLLILPFQRIMFIRPFAFGTFFLLYSIDQKGLLKAAISSSLLIFFYPYLAWFYTLPAAFAHFLRGDKRFALGAAGVTVLFLVFQPPSFWGFQVALFNSDLVRQAMDPKIGELRFTLNRTTFYIYAALLLLLFPMCSKAVKRLNYANLLILIYLLPALKYIRYFIDLTLPLLFVSFGSEALRVLTEPYAKMVAYWREALKATFSRFRRRAASMPAEAGSSQGKKAKSYKNKKGSLKPYIAVVYLLLLGLLIYRNYGEYASLDQFEAALSGIPAGTLVLADFGLQYPTLYTRPDLRLIPSCELGFPQKRIRKAYLAFYNQGDILPLARKTGAKFLLENKGLYINPLEGRYLKLQKKGRDLRVWRIALKGAQ